MAYVLQDKEWAVILETKKHPRKLGLIFTTQIVLLLRLSGLPDNLILKPFQTELSQRALFFPSSSTTIAGGKLLGI